MTPSVLLLSGGVDSAAVAVLARPDISLYVDYGQRSANAERRAAGAVAAELGIEHHELTVGLRSLGGGTLSDDELRDGWPSPEWWPYRNQMLITCAAAWLTSNLSLLGMTMPARATVVMGTVASDGSRHLDGTKPFYDAMNDVLATQEGHVTVEVPAIELATEDLIIASNIPDSVLAWTHSCHTANLPCGNCPGCHKRDQVLRKLDRLA